jgi:hypothetical protein
MSVKNLYWAVDEQRLVPGIGGGETVSTITSVLRDAMPVAIYLVTAQDSITAPYAVTSIGAGLSIKFGAKAALTDATYLSEQATWTETGSGSTLRYEASIPLDGAALIAAMTGLSSLTLFAEFTTQDGDGKHYDSTRFSLKIIPDVITGSEA